MSRDFKSLSFGEAQAYASARPTYPRELFRHLRELSPAGECAWDAGTGNGQAAVCLAEFFDLVIATDASAEQLEQATANPKVIYRVASSENVSIEDRSI